MKFTVDEKIKQIGIPVYGVRISNVKNKPNDDIFAQYKLNELSKIKSQISDDFIETDSVLKGFRELHTSLGISNRKNASASENLLSFLSKRGDIPSINLLVDIYNLVSVQSKLALGAHDVSHIKNNVTLKLTDGSEKFHPISYPEPKAIASGEYAYIDEDNEVLCRLEVRQCEKTKVTEDTTDVFYIVQGNQSTTKEEVKKTAEQLIDLTCKFCGGKAEILNEF